MTGAPVANDRIPHRAFIVLVPAMILEAGILILPGRLIAEAGTWGWLAMAITGAFVGLNITIIYWLLRRHNFPPVPQLLESLIGHWPARAVLVFVGVTLLLRAARIGRLSGELITQELLLRTPQWAVMVPGLLVVAYLTWHGFEPIARFVAITFPFYYGATMIMLLLVMLRADVGPLIVPADWSTPGMTRAVLLGIADVQGYGILFITLPWAWQVSRALPAVLGGWLLVYALGMLLLISSVAALGTSAAVSAWSTLDVIDLISVPGLFVERMESIFFMVWLFIIVTASILTVFAAAYLLAQAFTWQPRFRLFLPMVVLFVLILGLLPPTLSSVDTAAQQLRILGWIEISLPALLLGISLVRRRALRL